MKEVKINERAQNLVKASEVINRVTRIQLRLAQSDSRTNGLLNRMKKSKSSVQEVMEGKKGRSWGSLDKAALLDLISDTNRATYSSISSVGNILHNTNENIQDLSEMISALAMLSGLSFEAISETTSELEGLVEQLNESSVNNHQQSGQVKRIILSQIQRFKKEEKLQLEIDSNFGIINENLKNLEKKLSETIEDEVQSVMHKMSLNRGVKIDSIDGVSDKNESMISHKSKNQMLVLVLLISVTITNFLMGTWFLLYYFKVI